MFMGIRNKMVALPIKAILLNTSTSLSSFLYYDTYPFTKRAIEVPIILIVSLAINNDDSADNSARGGNSDK
jgi:hypothetical protein